MPAHLTVLLLFLIFFCVHLLVERGLALLNSRYIYARRNQLPPPEIMAPDAYARSVDYALTRARFGHVADLIGSAETLFFLFSGFIAMLSEWIRGFGFGPLTSGVLLIAAFSLVQMLLGLPLQLYSTFRIESRFGFNTTTPKTFWIDRVKGLVLAGVIGIPLLYAVLAFIQYSGPLWWLWASLAMIAFQFVMMILFPIFIAPWFNKFTPLDDGPLKSRLEQLAQQCNFAARGIFVMNGSKRSAHSNAFFTGIGKGRRIVLFDTLIQQMNVEELAAVLAHEIGHYKKKHIIQSVILSSLMMTAGFYVLSLLIDWRPLYEAFNVGAPSKAVGVLLFMLISSEFTFWVGPFFSALSRKHEYEADAYAAQQTSAPPMVAALLKLSEKNLGTLHPHPAYSAYHYSHPTVLERIGALKK
jgi:STE24 endopeptidase